MLLVTNALLTALLIWQQIGWVIVNNLSIIIMSVNTGISAAQLAAVMSRR